VIRLQKFLAECGVASRRQAEKLITSGRVHVNSEVAILGNRIDPKADTVTVDGRRVTRDSKVYIILNKPRGVVTSLKDTHARRTVMDCLAGLQSRVFPVGRLDMDVEGALLLTNDGELAYRLTHPKFRIEKVYLARVHGEMSPENAAQLERGVRLEDGTASASRVRIIRRSKRATYVELVMQEGKKREVKRLCEHVGHRVRELRRVSVCNITVQDLRPGEWRHLDPDELAALRAAVGLP